MLPAVAVVKVTVADTDVAALTVLERTMDGLTRPPKISENETYAPSRFAEAVSTDMETVEAAAESAEFFSPAKVHVTAVPEVTDAAVVTVSTRLAFDKVVVPALKPVQVRAEVGAVAASKFTPATVIALMLPVVAVVKVTVAKTLVAALTLLDRTIEGETSAALNIAGNVAYAPSRFADEVPVATDTLNGAVAAAAFLSAATVHVTTVAAAMDAGVVTVSTRLVVDKAAVPADMPVQV